MWQTPHYVQYMESKQKSEIATFIGPPDVFEEVKARKSLINRSNYDVYPDLLTGLISDQFSLHSTLFYGWFLS